MKIQKYLLFVLLFAAPLMAHAVRPPVPLVSYENIPVIARSGQTLTAAQVKEAIIQAAASNKWTANSAVPNVIVATLSVANGKHVVVVEITYDSTIYSIRYKDSINMGYGPIEGGVPGIHPYYNRWVTTLKDSILMQLLKY
jgi:hypothetical protein